jgi:hypothetical protein
VRTLALVSSITMASREGKLACGEGGEGAVVSICMQGWPRREGGKARLESVSRRIRVRQGSSGFVRVRRGSRATESVSRRIRVRQGSSGFVWADSPPRGCRAA